MGDEVEPCRRDQPVEEHEVALGSQYSWGFFPTQLQHLQPDERSAAQEALGGRA